MHFKISPLVVVSVLYASNVVAWPGQDSHVWMAPKSTDVRGPCPGLNTLANHGYLPRDGKNFTITTLMDGALKAVNLDSETVLVAAKFGLLTRDDTNSFDKLSLDALALHNVVEHDASISRNDWGDGSGDNLHFNETTFATLANSNPGKDYYDPVSAGEVQRARALCGDESPRGQHQEGVPAAYPRVWSVPQYLRKLDHRRRAEEVSFSRAAGMKYVLNSLPRFVNIFFREERLPIAEGWKRSPKLISVNTLDTIEHVIQNMSQWTATQSCEPLLLGSGVVL
ncbi:Chloroperoxidase [Mycena vitilis]|nr:Chloroperoxidase [Mycena vitilis]